MSSHTSLTLYEAHLHDTTARTVFRIVISTVLGIIVLHGIGPIVASFFLILVGLGVNRLIRPQNKSLVITLEKLVYVINEKCLDVEVRDIEAVVSHDADRMFLIWNGGYLRVDDELIRGGHDIPKVINALTDAGAKCTDITVNNAGDYWYLYKSLAGRIYSCNVRD